MCPRPKVPAAITASTAASRAQRVPNSPDWLVREEGHNWPRLGAGLQDGNADVLYAKPKTPLAAQAAQLYLLALALTLALA